MQSASSITPCGCTINFPGALKERGQFGAVQYIASKVRGESGFPARPSLCSSSDCHRQPLTRCDPFPPTSGSLGATAIPPFCHCARWYREQCSGAKASSLLGAWGLFYSVYSLKKKKKSNPSVWVCLELLPSKAGVCWGRSCQVTDFSPLSMLQRNDACRIQGSLGWGCSCSLDRVNEWSLGVPRDPHPLLPHNGWAVVITGNWSAKRLW